MSRNHEQTPTVVAGLLVLSTIMCLLTLGCGGDEEGPTAPDHNSEVFPLSTGNKWIYNYGWVDSIRTTVEIQGETWYEMGAFSLVVTRNPTLVRMNDDNQLIVKEPEGELVLFDFGVEVGTEWDYVWYEPGPDSLRYKITLESKTDSVEVFFGTFEECYRFYFNGRPAFDASWWFWVSPGTGIVRFLGGYGITYELTEFKADPQQDEAKVNPQNPCWDRGNRRDRFGSGNLTSVPINRERAGLTYARPNNCMNLAELVRHGACRASTMPAYVRRLRKRYTDQGSRVNE